MKSQALMSAATSTTTAVPGGGLADVDLVRLGARSGWLWRGHDLVLAGIGPAQRIGVERPEGGPHAQAILDELTGENELGDVAGTGAVGFGAFPFDPRRNAHLDVPSIVIGETTGVRWLTVFEPFTRADAARRIMALADDERKGPWPTKVVVTPGRPADEWRDSVVAVARDRVASSSLEKAVLARELVVTGDAPFDPATIVERLDHRFPGAMVFAIDGFVGASPELLVSRSGRLVNAHPLAGTAARSADTTADEESKTALLASSKDRSEHNITIEWLLNELRPACSYIDAEPEPSVVTLANVHHLGTIVEGMLSEPAVSILDLVAAVHPTPALGGAPQADALALIAELEGFDRARYGGPAGWVDAQGNGAFAVGVRTAQLTGDRATVCAGVGVVAQSDPQAELEETQAKFGALLGALLAGR
ncbi:MAG: isochorismate synthase [Acidimicrobiales bacterium]